MASGSLAFLPVKLSKHKLFYHGRFFNPPTPSHSSKVLTIARDQHKDKTSPSPAAGGDNEIIRRPVVSFHPSVWEDQFVSSSSSDLKQPADAGEKIEQLKKEVKSLLYAAATDPCQQLILIDKIQRLGVAYHFEADIDKVLQDIYHNVAHEDGDLYMVSLRFRLLRQAGHFVSPGVYNKFKDEKGEFQECLTHDYQGMLSLYEAAHLGCKDETILDEAIDFTTHHLKACTREQNHVERSLKLPLYKRMPRVEASYYVPVYEKEPGSHNDVLLQFAKLDYNALQLLHQAEISQLSRWWKEINLLSTLPFQARDRMVEGYAVVMLAMPEPKYSKGRIHQTKLFSIFTAFDDIFDIYGTLPELEQILDVISRWDVRDIYKLPEFAKGVVREMFKVFDEMEEEMVITGQAYTVSYLIRETQYYFKCLMDETKLFYSKRVPTLEEWLQISVPTIGVRFLTIGLTLSHWDLATKEAMDWSISDNQINHSSGRIGRILDDINTFKLEQERGILASSVTCYMKEHGVQECEAIQNLRKMVDNEWKALNEELMSPTTLPWCLLLAPVHIVRMAEILFMYGDGYTNSKGHIQETIASLLVNPLPA